MMPSLRRFSPHTLVVVGLLATIACHKNPPDLSQLSPEGLRNYRRLQVVKVVNDVTTGAIAASKANRIPSAVEDLILTINKQVLDVIAANPTNYREGALQIISNARQALSPELAAIAGPYLDIVLNVLNGILPAQIPLDPMTISLLVSAILAIIRRHHPEVVLTDEMVADELQRELADGQSAIRQRFLEKGLTPPE